MLWGEPEDRNQITVEDYDEGEVRRDRRARMETRIKVRVRIRVKLRMEVLGCKYLSSCNKEITI
jgi:hypothetical protein